MKVVVDSKRKFRDSSCSLLEDYIAVYDTETKTEQILTSDEVSSDVLGMAFYERFDRIIHIKRNLLPLLGGIERVYTSNDLFKKEKRHYDVTDYLAFYKSDSYGITFLVKTTKNGGFQGEHVLNLLRFATEDDQVTRVEPWWELHKISFNFKNESLIIEFNKSMKHIAVKMLMLGKFKG